MAFYSCHGDFGDWIAPVIDMWLEVTDVMHAAVNMHISFVSRTSFIRKSITTTLGPGNIGAQLIVGFGARIIAGRIIDSTAVPGYPDAIERNKSIVGR